jgi:uncharacterized protein YukJ
VSTAQLSPSELLFMVVEDFRHPVTRELAPPAEGFILLPSRPDSGALDFIRGNLSNRHDMRLLPHSLPGDDNDPGDRLAHFFDRAVREPGPRSTRSASAGGRRRATATRSSGSSRATASTTST